MMGEGAAICGDSFRVEWILIDSMPDGPQKAWPGASSSESDVHFGKIHLGEIGRGVLCSGMDDAPLCHARNHQPPDRDT